MSSRLRIALGIILILLGGTLLANQMDWLGPWETPVWSIVFVCTGVAFAVVAIGKEENWWALIPTCLFLALAGFIYVTEYSIISEDLAVGGFLALGLGLPFWLILLLRGRSFWWAAIPAGVLTFIALSVALASFGEQWTGAIVLWGIALPFWIIYFLNRERWWALIPAGTLTTVGATPLVADVWPEVAVAAVLFGGLALTFFLVYLLNGLSEEFRWAIWPAGVLLVMAVAIPVFGQWANLVWPVSLIVGGLLILVLALRRR
jgi:hypothetical protein